MAEEWRDVVGFEGLYRVSNLGRVFGVTWGKLRAIHQDRYGYPKVALSKEGVMSYHTVHRLVCVAFNGTAPPGKTLVLHNDGNPENNRPENLRWGTPQDNMDDKAKHGRNWWAEKEHCVHGHAYTPENTYRNPKTGYRSCHTCRYKYSAIANQQRSEKRRLENDRRN